MLWRVSFCVATTIVLVNIINTGSALTIPALPSTAKNYSTVDNSTCQKEPSSRSGSDESTERVGVWLCFDGPAMVAATGSGFCDQTLVNYPVACDLGDYRSCNDSYAHEVHGYFNESLSVYSCEEYSRLWNCTDCAAAYKQWLCGVLFKKCNLVGGAAGEGFVPAADISSSPGGVDTSKTIAESNRCWDATREFPSCLPKPADGEDPDAQPECVSKTCQDVCYEVVRKCPIHLGFTCPPTNDNREYSDEDTDGDGKADCNYLGMEQPDGASNVQVAWGLISLAVLLSMSL